MDLAIQSGHYASLPRKLPHPVQLAHLGHLPDKTQFVDWQFEVVAFSFILDGEGELSVDDGFRCAVRAPCVICEFPGPRFQYGPGVTWQELYLTYPATSYETFVRSGLIVPDRYIWPIRSVSRLRRYFEDLETLLPEVERPGNADRLDRLSESMIAETLLESEDPVHGTEHQRILRIKDFLTEHYTKDIDFDRMAERFGLSPSTFRRQWQRYVDHSPARFVSALRMKRACRLLCETGLSIAEIAGELGFADPLYFSKKFHKYAGEPARSYRKRFASLERAARQRAS